MSRSEQDKDGINLNFLRLRSSKNGTMKSQNIVLESDLCNELENIQPTKMGLNRKYEGE